MVNNYLASLATELFSNALKLRNEQGNENNSIKIYNVISNSLGRLCLSSLILNLVHHTKLHSVIINTLALCSRDSNLG
jgi:hypothetical protein